MQNVQLRQWLKEAGITQEEAARATSYTLNYVNSVLNGRHPMTGDAILRFIQAYPGTAAFLLPESVVKSLISTDERDRKAE